jgi:two-component system sensor histidine kinase KdpD
MVCLSSNPRGSKELLRKGSRTAGELNADWYAVHVETPAESVQKISTSDFRALLDNVSLAADLGAEVVWLKSDNVLQALLDFARDKQITKIVVGRTRPGFWSRLFRGSVTNKLIDRAENIDIEVVGLEDE